LNKSRFFKYLSIFLTGFLIGILIFYFFFRKEKNINVPVVKIVEIKDTIPFYEFKILKIHDTLYLKRPFLWKEFFYQDSLIKVKFETDTFRNFEYSILKKEVLILPGIKKNEKIKYGEIFVGISLNKNFYFGSSYKFFMIGFKYNFKFKNFEPFIGLRFQF
jgi:hypothetical protein